MKKSELRTGMIIETRCGDECLVMLNMQGSEDRLISLEGSGYYPLTSIEEDLTNCYSNYDFDIVKVSNTPTHKIDFNAKSILWERPKYIKEHTIDELIEKVGYEFKIKKSV